jgi:hypothetical protein
MKSKLSDLASLAEIVAAVGVILSLLFVGFQISDGNREIRAATIQATLDSEIAVQAEMLRYADTWEKVASGAPLSDRTETREAILLFNMLMTMNENLYLQFESGYIESARGGLETVVAFPFYEIWRNSAGATSRSPSFLELTDDLRTRHSGE